MSVKLARLVGRLEGKAAKSAAEAAAASCEFGLVWSSDQKRVDPETLQPGDLVALDITIEGFSDGTPRIRSVERVTRDPEDLGLVYAEDVPGEVVGRIIERDGRFFTWCLRDEYARREGQRAAGQSGPSD